MKFDPEVLEARLGATGLPCNPSPFIHGAITASALSPEALSNAEFCTLLFSATEKEVPARGVKDKRILNAIGLVRSFENEIFQEIDGDVFSPYLGKDDSSATRRETAHEWCRGFLAAIGLQKKWWYNKESFPEMEQLLAIVTYCGLPQGYGIPQERRPELDALFADPALPLIEAVQRLYDYWMEKIAATGDVAHQPLVRQEKKAGRNDPCPCGSGKKSKKCCGKG